MKRITLFACILCFGFFTTTQALAGEPATFDGLVKKVVTALQSGDQAGFQQLFITMEAMDKSITELETYPSKKEKAKTLKRYQKSGRAKIEAAWKDAQSTTWNTLNSAGVNWKQAQIRSIEPAHNNSNGVEMIDWARVVIQDGDKTYFIKFNQARATPDGWRLVLGARIKGPMRK